MLEAPPPVNAERRRRGAVMVSENGVKVLAVGLSGEARAAARALLDRAAPYGHPVRIRFVHSTEWCR